MEKEYERGNSSLSFTTDMMTLMQRVIDQRKHHTGPVTVVCRYLKSMNLWGCTHLHTFKWIIHTFSIPNWSNITHACIVLGICVYIHNKSFFLNERLQWRNCYLFYFILKNIEIKYRYAFFAFFVLDFLSNWPFQFNKYIYILDRRCHSLNMMDDEHCTMDARMYHL